MSKINSSNLPTQSLKISIKRKKTPEQLVLSATTALNLYLTFVLNENNEEINKITTDTTNTIPISSIPCMTIDNSIDSKTSAELTLRKRLRTMKLLLYGDGHDHSGSSTTSSTGSDIDEAKINELALCIQTEGFILLLLTNYELLPFESKKDTALVFNCLIRRNLANFTEYVNDNKNVIIYQLVNGYNYNISALSCGSMLREIIRYESLHKAVLQYINTKTNELIIWEFFDTYVHLPNFDIASDAFNTLRDLLVVTKNKQIVAEFLDINYDKLFQKYDLLLLSSNYVTRRRSLKMLSEILLDKSYFVIMMRYIASKANLKTIMNMLRDKSPNIQLEAFHVFKIFVANPHKPVDIASVLSKNATKLVSYLNNFHNDKDDAQFIDEKKLLIDKLTGLSQNEKSSDILANSSDKSINK